MSKIKFMSYFGKRRLAMTNQYIRLMKLSELQSFYKFIERDFPPDEYPPYDAMYYHLQEGIQEGLVFCNEFEDLAYAICAASHSNNYALISQIAVFLEHRGKGIGSSFLKAIREKYKEKKGIIVEVEIPEYSETLEEAELRRRRIAFYKNLDFHMIPNIKYSIWDIPMHLMALPLKVSFETINQEIEGTIYEIYNSLVGKRFIHKVEFQKL